MSEQIKSPDDRQPAGEEAEQFFRDIEIEFLVHELKDPIAVIETGLRTLLERQDKFGPLSARQEKTLKRTLRNSKKARELLHNMLEIGRAEAGCFLGERFRPAQSIIQALEDALETGAGGIFDKYTNYQSAPEALEYLKTCGIVVTVAPEVNDLEMFQDETKFRQVVGNLMKNALHHRQQRIEVRLEKEGDDLVVAIIDDGPGIEPEHHQMVFQRYAQVKECAIVARKGHGLGLAGANIISRCMGGKLTLESAKGQGATFCLTIPLSLDSD
ncbi:MAG: HAMP domain-containing sensor histidine kinase [Desulfobacterales bacterium]|nr:HAMP domain-containing sensor histidine kinase [Desulfobacterales bacterium]